MKKGLFMGILRWVLGVALLPVCAAATRTLVSLLQSLSESSSGAVPAAAMALGGGCLFWVFLYFTVPHPVRSYVLAHELTHALWASVMGARVSNLRVRGDSGSVTLSKTTFLSRWRPIFSLCTP